MIFYFFSKFSYYEVLQVKVGHDWGGFVTWAVAEDFPDKVKKAVIANVPHLSIFSAALRSSFRQICRSWYIGMFFFCFVSHHSYLQFSLMQF